MTYPNVMKKPLYVVTAVFIVVLLITLWDVGGYYFPGDLEKPTTLVFAPNSHFSDIVDSLAENHVIKHSLIFKILMTMSGQSFKVKAGEYAFSPHISEEDVAWMLANGKTVIHHLTVPEGLMTFEVIEMVKKNELLTGEITLDMKEGDLFPETYNYSRGDKRNDIIERMHHSMQKALDEAWQGRADNLPFTTPQQVLILASVVEKETGLVTERQHVASVYINRLKKGMLLQADPTTAYAVTGGKYKLTRPLTRDDLNYKSLYNTYQFPGLPPGPIANPGKAAIIATLHPMQSDDLYFVATGTGGHNFARTPQEHAKNVEKYREAMRMQSK